MRRIGKALGYVDEFIWLLIWLAGLALTVVLIVGGAGLLDVLVVVILTAAVALTWALQSNVWDWLRGREP